MTSPALIDRLWAQIEPIVFITRDQFVRGLEAWDVTPVEIDGELAFCTLVQGPEFHFTSFGTGHRIMRDMIRSHIEPIIAEHGFVTTRTPKDDNRQTVLNRRLGFKVTREDEFFVHARLDRPCL